MTRSKFSENAKQIIKLVVTQRYWGVDFEEELKAKGYPTETQLMFWVTMFEKLNPIEKEEKEQMIQYLLESYKWSK